MGYHIQQKWRYGMLSSSSGFRPRLQASGRGTGPGGGVPGIAQHDVELLLDLRRSGSAEESLGDGNDGGFWVK